LKKIDEKECEIDNDDALIETFQRDLNPILLSKNKQLDSL